MIKLIHGRRLLITARLAGLLAFTVTVGARMDTVYASEPRAADLISTIGMGARVGATVGLANDDSEPMLTPSALPEPNSPQVSAISQIETRCDSDHFRVRLNAVCPMEADASDVRFFEQAKKPTLSVEFSSGRKDETNGHRVLASLAPSFSARPPVMKTWVIATMDLLSEGLFGESLPREFSVSYPDSAERNQGPAGVSKAERVVISVCDDKNGNGKCSDEDSADQLTVRNPSFSPCEMPKVVSVTVWAGCGR